MCAELHGTLGRGGSGDFTMPEDLLTDCIFGTLAYLPSTVLSDALSVLAPGAIANKADLDRPEFEFWPDIGGRTEPDLVITVSRAAIIVDAKYRCDFSCSVS